MMDDWAAKIAALAAGAAGTPDAAATIAARLRAELGGQRVRIEARPPVTLERIDAGLRSGKTVARIAADMGVHRETVYRHLRRKSPRRAACDTPAA